MRKLLEDNDSCLCQEIKYFDGELFICAGFLDDNLPENLLFALGRLLMLSGQEYIEFGYPRMVSRLRLQPHGGGTLSLYSKGILVCSNILDKLK
jgi:hypothetical protein